MRAARVALGSLLSCLGVEALADPAAGMTPLAALHAVDLSAPRALPTVLRVDLATGHTYPDCPSGAWTGTAYYLDPVSGPLVYRGSMVGCLAHGYGYLNAADGSQYAGMVESFLASAEAPLRSGQVRPAVPHGLGRYIHPADGMDRFGTFQRGEFVADLRRDATVVAVFNSAANSQPERERPIVTPEVRALLAQATAVPPSAGRMPWTFQISNERSGLHVSRSVPAAVLDTADFSALRGVVGRYGLETTKGRKGKLETGMMSDECKVGKRKDTVLKMRGLFDSGLPARAYLGEHRQCYPQGSGRIEYSDGAVWVGGVNSTYLVTASGSEFWNEFPMPDGLGLFVLPNGRTLLLHLAYEPAQPRQKGDRKVDDTGHLRVIHLHAVFEPDGTVAWYDQRSPRDAWGSDEVTEADMAALASADREGILFRPDGTMLRGRLQDGRPHPAWPLFTWRDDARGLVVSGQLGRDAQGQRVWTGLHFVGLTHAMAGIGPGAYASDTQLSRQGAVPWDRSELLVGSHLQVLDLNTYDEGVSGLAAQYQAALTEQDRRDDHARAVAGAQRADEEARARAARIAARAARRAQEDRGGFQWGKFGALMTGAAIGGLGQLDAQSQARFLTGAVTDSVAGNTGVAASRASMPQAPAPGGTATGAAAQAPMQTYTLNFSCGPHDSGKSIPIQYRTQACLNRKIEYAKAAACNDMARANAIGLPVCE